MTVFRRRLRKLRFFLQAAVVTLIITAAVLVGFAQLALPWLADNPQRIEGWLSQRLGRPVSIGHVGSLWTRAGPRLVFDDLRIEAGAGGGSALLLPRAELALNLYAAFQRNRAWNEFRLVGLDLSLVRGAQGEWHLRGIDASSSTGGSMGALGAVVLVDLKLSVVDEQRDLKLDLRVPELRVVNLGNITRILGQVGSKNAGASPLTLVADVDTAERSGQLYVGGRNLDLAELAAGHSIGGTRIVSSNGDIGIWSNWHKGRIEDIWTRLALSATVLEATSEVRVDDQVAVIPRSAFDELGMTAHWQRVGQGWTLDVADATSTRQGVASAPARFTIQRMDGPDARYQAAGNALDFSALGSLGMLSTAVPDALRHWLYLANPRGTLSAIELRWDAADDFDVDALVSAFGCRDAGAIPGIEPLDFRLTGDAGALLMAIPRQATQARYPKVFRKPFDWTAFGGDVLAWRDGDGWRVQTAQVSVEAANYAVDLRGGMDVQGDGSRPLLDLSALVTRGDVEAAKLFWTVNTMPPHAVDWLDRSLVAGSVTRGRALVRGDLDNWPFNDDTGRFEARADLHDLELAYLRDWPSGDKLDVVARFINNGMQAHASSGRSMGVAVDNVEATIADFHEPVLELAIDGKARGADLLSYLRATPIGTHHAAYLAGLGIGGRGRVHVDISAPLKASENTTLQGRVELDDADLDESTWDLHFKQASGLVRFDRTGVLAEPLAARYEDQPVSLGIAIGSSASDPDNAFEARLDGILPASVVFARASDLAPAMPYFPGQANWHVDLAIGAEQGAASERKRLRLASDLEGVAINLPAPLAKAAATKMPFSLELQMPPLGQPFTASLGDVVRVHGRLPGPASPLAARLDLGPGSATEPPPEKGVFVAGHPATVDADGWIALFTAGGTGGDFLNGMAIDVDDLRMAGRSFPGLHIDLEPQKEATSIRVRGEALEGELSVSTVDLNRRGITAQMKHVRWPDLPAGDEGAPAPLSGVAPATLPPLHLWVGELQFGTSNFGDTRLESYPTANGMRIDLLESKSANLDMRATGDWEGPAGENRSHLVIDMTAKSLGSMLDTFGYEGIIEGGQTFARIDATWPGAPTAFALANTNGTLDIGVENGRILDVDPGASGRLFGLLSLREIPRRLSLDFSDLFKSGMSFNSIKGSFVLADGNATTHDLVIASPAADITISGRTGLRDKDYDQEMVVVPRAGVALPVVGALAGGPVGAAAGIVVQTLIGKKLNHAARSRYRVTGSWEKPVIALISRESAKESARQQGNPASGTPAIAEPASGPAPGAPGTAPANPDADSAGDSGQAAMAGNVAAPDQASAAPEPVPAPPAPAAADEKPAERPSDAAPPKQDEPDPQTGARTRRG